PVPRPHVPGHLSDYFPKYPESQIEFERAPPSVSFARIWQRALALPSNVEGLPGRVHAHTSCPATKDLRHRLRREAAPPPRACLAPPSRNSEWLGFPRRPARLRGRGAHISRRNENRGRGLMLTPKERLMHRPSSGRGRTPCPLRFAHWRKLDRCHQWQKLRHKCAIIPKVRPKPRHS